jgi:tRNA 2-thiouridine synthesizing protein A
MKANSSPESLDARGRRCSMLSMSVSQRMSPLPPGAELEVLTDDPAAPTEMPAWCKKMGHELLSFETNGDEHRMRIRRGV